LPIDLVTGGSGFIGRHVVAALQGSGVGVRVLDLAPPDDTVGPNVEFMAGSILDPKRVEAAMTDVRHVYHLAGIAKLWTRDRSDFDRVNAVGTATVMRAAAARGVARLVHCSTEAILLPARRTEAIIDETVQPEAKDMPGPYTRSKLAAEQSVLAAVDRGLDALIVNPTVPIGPGDRNLTPPAAMLAMFLNGQSPAYLDCTLNLVDVRDVAAGMVLAASKGRTGERYILGGENVRLSELLRLLERFSNRQMPTRAIPDWLALAAAGVAEWMADHVTGRVPAATREGVKLALRSGPFDSRKARIELGYVTRVLQDTLDDAISWLRAAGVIRGDQADA
jgi:dihydroflavonol-4-reductase